MTDIQVGEYVRTYEGEIGKIIDLDIDVGICTDIRKEPFAVDEIAKHSKNIIDLIEIGDFVNNRIILQVDHKNRNICLLIPSADTKANVNIMWYGDEDIKTILTKEQYQKNCYKAEQEAEYTITNLFPNKEIMNDALRHMLD